ncbi:hypothetical protein TWF225_005531 [Orbilia oligospora]|uniref:Uncharacterized protein n=1 Tax=Orbilia oligospora TaxID=2813651 RepID=A0A7C8KEE8_ORBOL|nr:hypothetical protein TWF751_005438 [Orbilia oligospora]KAF3194913.1 hypothetical protein TWF225_005531 [Orbilia oligospora]KAF3259836.1 hypothetical protein TWF128_003830 [Orbilia oligospora]KAF3259837.1 hypothetical protein TWF128_003830 [Orbilia oligospora]KAF3270854.1 hypothetical protein TWF217_007129 [Orbilia oligospora]
MLHEEATMPCSHTGIRQRRRMAKAAPSTCSKSFTRYCVALLGSLTAVSMATPVLDTFPTVPSRDGYVHGGIKVSRNLLSPVENMGSTQLPKMNLHRLYTRATNSINKAAIIVGVCGGLALVFAVVGAYFFWRIRQKHRDGTCGCDEKGIACKYRQRVPSSASFGEEEEEEEGGHGRRHSRVKSRDISPPTSPRQKLLSPPLHHQPGDRNRWSTSSSRNSGQFYDVEGFEYPQNYKPPPSSFRAHSPSASMEFLVPAAIANLISPITPRDPLLAPRGIPNNDDGVTITPPRTPSPAIFAKRSQSPHTTRALTPEPGPSQRQLLHNRGRSLSFVDLSRSDAELQEDLDAIARELQRRPRSGSIDSRLMQTRSNSPQPPTASQDFIMELEASPGMWNEDMQRNRGEHVVHEAVSQEFAVELDSRPLTLGLPKRTRRLTSRFQ